MSETTAEDHLIILRELLAVKKTLATSSSIRAQVNGSRKWLESASKLLACERKVTFELYHRVMEGLNKKPAPRVNSNLIVGH